MDDFPVTVRCGLWEGESRLWSGGRVICDSASCSHTWENGSARENYTAIALKEHWFLKKSKSFVLEDFNYYWYKWLATHLTIDGPWWSWKDFTTDMALAPNNWKPTSMKTVVPRSVRRLSPLLMESHGVMMKQLRTLGVGDQQESRLLSLGKVESERSPPSLRNDKTGIEDLPMCLLLRAPEQITCSLWA